MDTTHPQARVIAVQAKKAGEEIEEYESLLHEAIDNRWYRESKTYIDAILERQDTLSTLCGQYENLTREILSPVELARATR